MRVVRLCVSLCVCLSACLGLSLGIGFEPWPSQALRGAAPPGLLALAAAARDRGQLAGPFLLRARPPKAKNAWEQGRGRGWSRGKKGPTRCKLGSFAWILVWNGYLFGRALL